MSILLERALRAAFSPQVLTILGTAIGTAIAVGLWKRLRRERPVNDRREHTRLGDE